MGTVGATQLCWAILGFLLLQGKRCLRPSSSNSSWEAGSPGHQSFLQDTHHSLSVQGCPQGKFQRLFMKRISWIGGRLQQSKSDLKVNVFQHRCPTQQQKQRQPKWRFVPSILDTFYNITPKSTAMSLRTGEYLTILPSPTSESVLTVAAFGESGGEGGTWEGIFCGIDLESGYGNTSSNLTHLYQEGLAEGKALVGGSIHLELILINSSWFCWVLCSYGRMDIEGCPILARGSRLRAHLLCKEMEFTLLLESVYIALSKGNSGLLLPFFVPISASTLPHSFPCSGVISFIVILVVVVIVLVSVVSLRFKCRKNKESEDPQKPGSSGISESCSTANGEKDSITLISMKNINTNNSKRWSSAEKVRFSCFLPLFPKFTFPLLF
nr:endothelial cell-specific chemotaxis regulator [Loxodonta africana]